MSKSNSLGTRVNSDPSGLPDPRDTPVRNEPRTDYDRRSLTEDQRYLAEDIATSMPDRHDETCGVWSEDGDGCDCPLVMAIADGLHASHVVSVEVERGWDPSTGRGERTVHLPFRPMPVEAEAASPAALDVERLGAALRTALLLYPLASHTPELVARGQAAEYARLSPSEGSGE